MRDFSKADALEGMKPGNWVEIEGADGRLLKIGCPSCGNVLALAKHRIGPRGVVVPPVRCSYEGCGFHDAARLLGHPATEAFEADQVRRRDADRAAAAAKAKVEAKPADAPTVEPPKKRATSKKKG